MCILGIWLIRKVEVYSLVSSIWLIRKVEVYSLVSSIWLIRKVEVYSLVSSIWLIRKVEVYSLVSSIWLIRKVEVYSLVSSANCYSPRLPPCDFTQLPPGHRTCSIISPENQEREIVMNANRYFLSLSPLCNVSGALFMPFTGYLRAVQDCFVSSILERAISTACEVGFANPSPSRGVRGHPPRTILKFRHEIATSGDTFDWKLKVD